VERITRIEARSPYILYVEFDDGVAGEYDMRDRLHGPMYEPLRDPAYFAQVTLADWGAPVWPNGLDLAPDALHERLATRERDGARGA
jgi:Protein of unknown function (DUF2442)